MMKTIKHISVGALGFMLMLLILDGFIRLAGIENTSLTRYDYTLGKIRPAQQSYIMFNEGFSVGAFNAGGYMHQYYPPRDSSQAGVVRVAVFGDSYAEGFQVFERDHFVRLLEEGLQNKYPNQTIEVLNFGYSGFDIGDMYVYSQLIAADYSPDMMLFLLSKADLQLNYRMPYSPRAVADSLGLHIVRPYSQEKLARYKASKVYLNYSTLASMLNKARKTSQEDLLIKCFDKFYIQDKTNTPVLDEYRTNTSDSLGLASRLIIETLQDKLLVVNRDDKPMPKELTDFVTHLNIPYVDLSVPLQDLYQKGIDPHYWEVTNKYGHWNKAGHRAVADYLVKELPRGLFE